MGEAGAGAGAGVSGAGAGDDPSAEELAFDERLQCETTLLESELTSLKQRIEATSLVPTLTAALELQLLRQHSAAVRGLVD